MEAPADQYEMKVGFFDLKDGQRYGEAIAGVFDFRETPPETRPATRPVRAN
jgi:hypothetical protein